MPAQLRKISSTPKRLQSENGLFFIEDMSSIIVYSANYYRHYYRHLIVSYDNGGNKLFVLHLY
jgi:hypothetical protein